MLGNLPISQMGYGDTDPTGPFTFAATGDVTFGAGTITLTGGAGNKLQIGSSLTLGNNNDTDGAVYTLSQTLLDGTGAGSIFVAGGEFEADGNAKVTLGGGSIKLYSSDLGPYGGGGLSFKNGAQLAGLGYQVYSSSSGGTATKVIGIGSWYNRADIVSSLSTYPSVTSEIDPFTFDADAIFAPGYQNSITINSDSKIFYSIYDE
jgi:hypothetical protein